MVSAAATNLPFVWPDPKQPFVHRSPTTAKSARQSLVRNAAKGGFEPKPTDAAPSTNGCNRADYALISRFIKSTNALTRGFRKAEGSCTLWIGIVRERNSGNSSINRPVSKPSPRNTSGQMNIPRPAKVGTRHAGELLARNGPEIGTWTVWPSIWKGQRFGSGLFASRMQMWSDSSAGCDGAPCLSR